MPALSLRQHSTTVLCVYPQHNELFFGGGVGKIPCDIENSSGASDVQQLDLELIFFEQDTRIPKLIGKNFIKLVDILNVSEGGNPAINSPEGRTHSKFRARMHLCQTTHILIDVLALENSSASAGGTET